MRIGVDARPLCGVQTGIGRYLFQALKALSEIDHSNEYYLYSHKDFVSPTDNPKFHKRVGKWYVKGVGGIYFLYEVKKRIEEDRVEVFWGTQEVLPFNLKIPSVLTVHDFAWYYFPRTLTFYNLMLHKLLVRRSIAAAKHLIAISHATASDMQAIFAVSAQKTTVIYHGIDKIFCEQNKEACWRAINNRYAVRGKYVLAVGTVEPRKNLGALLQAFRRLLDDKLGDCQLIIVGDKGWKNAGFYHLYESLQFSEAQVKLLGYVPQNDLVKLYGGAEAFVYPSLHEGFGFPPLEAMACGCPVIVSAIPSLREVCQEAAHYIDPRDDRTIKEALQLVLTDASYRQKLKEKALEQVKSFKWDKSASLTLEVLQKTGRNICPKC